MPLLVWLVALHCIREVRTSNLGPETESVVRSGPPGG